MKKLLSLIPSIVGTLLGCYTIITTGNRFIGILIAICTLVIVWFSLISFYALITGDNILDH